MYIFLGGDDVDDTVWDACAPRQLLERKEIRKLCRGTDRNRTNKFTSASARAENGVSGGGLITAVQPAASAAPSLRVTIALGKFHGVRIDLKRVK